MDPVESNSEVGVELDVFGQNPRLSRLYTQLCFCFAFPDSNPQHQPRLTTQIEAGLERLRTHFPWVAGVVIRDAQGVYRIQSHGAHSYVITQDRRGDLPSMSTMQEAGFPFSMLDETIVAGCKTLPGDFDDPAPVFLTTLTFVQGGLILNFDGQHNCMDMAGLCEVIRLFAKACRNESFTQEEIRNGNLPRGTIFPRENDPPLPRTPASDPSPPLTTEAQPTPASTHNTVWAYFLFPSSSLSALKTLATQTQTTPFISTDDALSALIWQSLTRARAPDLHSNPGNTTSAFERQVNARAALALPATYTGNVVHKTRTEQTPWHSVPTTPLGVLASSLRTSLGTSEEIAAATKASAAGIRRMLDTQPSFQKKPGEKKGGERNERKVGIAATEIRMSSWAKERCAEFDFGERLGCAKAVRRPAFAAWEGLVYLMPKDRHGGIAVAVCLGQEAMERLREDEGFVKFGKYVG